MIFDPRLTQAEHLIKVRRSADARGLLASALSDRPDDATAHQLMSRAIGSDDPAESLLHARAAIASAPDDPDSHLVLSEALARVGSAHDAAVAAYEAVRLAPHSPVAKCVYARTLSKLPDGQAIAVAMARQAVGEAPNSVGAWVTLGFVQHTSDPAAARSCYERALALDPTCAAAVQNIASLEHNRSHLGSAITGYAAALSMDPTLEIARDNLNRTLNRAITLGVVTLIVLLEVALHSKEPLLTLGLVTLVAILLLAVAVAWLPRDVRRSLGVTLAPGVTRSRTALAVIGVGATLLAAGIVIGAVGGPPNLAGDLGGGGVAVMALGAIFVSLSMRRLRRSSSRG